MAGPEDQSKEIERQAAAVLGGRASYDDIGPNARRRVRTAWASRIAAHREALNLEEKYLAGGATSWSEADPDGNVVIRDAQSVREGREHE